MKIDFFLSVPKSPGSIDNPSFEQIEWALRNEDFYGGSLADVSLTYVEFNDPNPRVSAKLFFWLDSPDQVATFYQGSGAWWGFSNGIKSGDDLEIDDGGGNEIMMNDKFLQPTEFALGFCKQMMGKGFVEIGSGWDKVSGRYLG
tara:strand:+ start:889 stop:1320 length:432 start_codon:yes stop_codon:yes gene_type:complete